MIQLKLLTLLGLAVCAFSAPFGAPPGSNDLKSFMGLELVGAAESHLPADVYQSTLIKQAPADSDGYQSLELMQQMMLGSQTPEVRKGVRPEILYKDGDGKLGLRIMSISKGIYVVRVTPDSPADVAGIRFGEQILDVDGKSLEGYRGYQVKTMLNEGPQRIELAVRERPMERSITIQKDSTGHVGFLFKNGRIISINKDSSAARNGLLIGHSLLEINGQSVAGLKTEEIRQVLDESDRTFKVTIIPTFVYDHFVKSFASSDRHAIDV